MIVAATWLRSGIFLPFFLHVRIKNYSDSRKEVIYMNMEFISEKFVFIRNMIIFALTMARDVFTYFREKEKAENFFIFL